MPWLEVDGTYHHLPGKTPLTPRAAEALRQVIRLAQERYRAAACAGEGEETEPASGEEAPRKT